MNTRLSCGLVVAAIGLCTLGAAYAETPLCAPGAAQVNRNNSIVMLGGTSRGAIKQFVLGEFGKDVNQQKRMLGQFDRCGALVRADISYEKQEGNMQITLVQNIERAAAGWRSGYDLSISQLRNGSAVEVSHRSGTIDYQVGRSGNITSSSEVFLQRGEKGFALTVNYFDAKSRLVRSLSRGSDSYFNGESLYRWNKQNQLISSHSPRNEMRWDYDSQDREKAMFTQSNTPLTTSDTQDECQLWDDRGNCTLSYSREMEISPAGIIRRHITAAYRYEYWDAAVVKP